MLILNHKNMAFEISDRKRDQYLGGFIKTIFKKNIKSRSAQFPNT